MNLSCMLVDFPKHYFQFLVASFLSLLHGLLKQSVRFYDSCGFPLLELHLGFKGLQFAIVAITCRLDSAPHVGPTKEMKSIEWMS
jgi:hypothetical protein